MIKSDYTMVLVGDMYIEICEADKLGLIPSHKTHTIGSATFKLNGVELPISEANIFFDEASGPDFTAYHEYTQARVVIPPRPFTYDGLAEIVAHIAELLK